MANTLLVTLLLNNQTASFSSATRITNANPNLNWSFVTSNILNIDEYTSDLLGSIVADQRGYEIRIANDADGWGTDGFIGDRVHTGFVFSQDRFWNYSGVPLDRETTYYGQFFVEDEIDRESGWIKFLFHFNSLPQASNISISPVKPLITDTIILNYNFSDIDGDNESGTVIRWFKNGIRQRQFDDTDRIASEFLNLGDLWFADIMPGDGFENGLRSSSPVVEIVKADVVTNDVEILPNNPNENDILQAKYKTNNIFEEDSPTIRWFVNGTLKNQFNDEKFARLPISVGDVVRFEVRPGGSDLFVSSQEKKIVSSKFVVYDIVIDGQQDPFKVSSLGPTISWKVFKPEGKEVNYINIKIGTFFEADNILSTTVQLARSTFTVPPNTLQRGRDYFVSVAVSDINSFDNFTGKQFRVVGSRWEEGVSNNIGWTIETIFLLDTTSIEFDEDLYQVVRINDGSYFAEVRIYHERIGFVSEKLILSKKVDTSGSKILTIIGKGTDVKIYLNRKLILDATGLFVKITSKKILEIGNVTGEAFIVRYKFFHYTVSGAFNPGVSDEFSNIKFHRFLEFENNEIVSLKGFTRRSLSDPELETGQDVFDFKVFGVNPDDTDESGAIYAIVPRKPFKASTVNRTFAPINKIRQSPNGKKVTFAHAKGVSVVTGYVINNYDVELNFVDTNGVVDNDLFPEDNGWHLVHNVKHVGGFFDEVGFNIDTIRGQ